MLEVIIMQKEKKIPYETPVIMPLGELARGLGVACRAGSTPTGTCSGGAGVPPPDCRKGQKAGFTCDKGNQVGP